MLEFCYDILDFIKVRRKFWLAPLILAILIIGGLTVFAQGSVLAPFIYTFF